MYRETADSCEAEKILAAIGSLQKHVSGEIATKKFEYEHFLRAMARYLAIYLAYDCERDEEKVTSRLDSFLREFIRGTLGLAEIEKTVSVNIKLRGPVPAEVPRYGNGERITDPEDLKMWHRLNFEGTNVIRMDRGRK